MKNSNELKLFFPWGAIGSGYWLSESEIIQIKSKINLAIIITNLTFIIFSFAFGVFRGFLAACIYYFIHCLQLLFFLKNKTKSDKKMKISNNLKNFSHKIGFIKIILCILICTLLIYIGISLILSSKSILIGFLTLIVFSINLLIFLLLFYFKLKNREKS